MFESHSMGSRSRPKRPLSLGASQPETQSYVHSQQRHPISCRQQPASAARQTGDKFAYANLMTGWGVGCMQWLGGGRCERRMQRKRRPNLAASCLARFNPMLGTSTYDHRKGALHQIHDGQLAEHVYAMPLAQVGSAVLLVSKCSAYRPCAIDDSNAVKAAIGHVMGEGVDSGQTHWCNNQAGLFLYLPNHCLFRMLPELNTTAGKCPHSCFRHSVRESAEQQVVMVRHKTIRRDPGDMQFRHSVGA